MHRRLAQASLLVLLLFLFSCVATVDAADGAIHISPDWSRISGISKTQISIQVCPEPPMRRGHPIHDQLFSALRDLKVGYARFQPWRPYPRLAVAELYPPQDGKTSWDFSLIDPLVEDFMSASEGRPVIFTFGTIPSWMLKTEKPDGIPQDPDEITWTYGMEPHFTDFDSTVELFAQYEARLAQWYLKGGFKDEYGKWHGSEHHYNNVAYWGVLNETGAEHALTPAQYNKVYDAVVAAVKQVAPQMKFIGPSTDDTLAERALPNDIVYFLNSGNHAPGTPRDALSYHFYATPDWDETPEVLEHTTFKDADRLLTAASYIEVLRQHFSPTTQTILEELGGSFLPWANTPEQIRAKPIDSAYWNLSGAMWAYLYGHLVGMGIDMLHGAELIDYPGQVASTTLVDWDTGKPTARYWVLKLIHDELGPGDKIVAPADLDYAPADLSDYDAVYPSARVYSQGFITAKGQRKLLLVNKRDMSARLIVAGARSGTLRLIDQTTTAGPVERKLDSETVELQGFSVGILTLAN
jgi:hypothetical protein